MRRIGQIYQIKHRDGKYLDQTQGLVRTNLKAGGGPSRKVSIDTIGLELDKIYKILLSTRNGTSTGCCLIAAEEEFWLREQKVFLQKKEENQELSGCYWQFIPTRRGGPRWSRWLDNC